MSILNENMIRQSPSRPSRAAAASKGDHAMGEQQAAEESSRLPTSGPGTTGEQLRYFAGLHDTASERSSPLSFRCADLLSHLVPRPEGAR